MVNKKIINFFLFSTLSLLLIFFLILISQTYQCQNCQNKNNQSIQVCFQDHCFKSELAISEAQRAKGLMYRQQLAQKEAMLFIFAEEGIYPFWMKNTLIPLDIIWLNQEKKVVFIKKNAQPCQSLICPAISPNYSASYVLEINGGISEKINLQIGDQIIFK